MLILTIRTDKPEAEIGLYVDETKLKYEIWTAHRQLAETLHTKIYDLLTNQKKDWSDIEGIICFKGPGSFTGLRIGLTVANALAESLSVPIIGAQNNDWQERGIQALLDGQNEKLVVPDYGSPVHITLPKS
ncbi:MAG TPA: tRNA (adenosine(37)-N6)-threonylcarbamoyltransferase complex dimerization subunit type 1 TsaB [Candidatus Saccharimonadales bacterium]|nr:tRNA (adenosine(37)-N6)-threonylcarbamoyltransferase complex dimerization subunit type 1 TsaB [Candidatus Saccharimonadales bacterium]